MGLARRTVLGGLAVTAVAGIGGVALVPLMKPVPGAAEMTPPDVLDAVQSDTILLIDIRRPEEWADTGVPRGAVPIDMRRPDFADAVQQARTGPMQPVALICARGVRSRRMTARLRDAGITPIIDVPEGMLGSFAGPGWLERGLPVDAWTG